MRYLIACLSIFYITIDSLQAQDLLSARSAIGAGRYQEALDLSQKNLDKPASDGIGTELAEFLQIAVTATQSLNKISEVDSILEKATDRHSKAAELLLEAAKQYSSLEHAGYIESGKFYRGYSRGGQVEYANCADRDRIRALQLLMAAIENSRTQLPNERFKYFSTLADVIRQNTAGWQLQQKSDLTELPEIEKGYAWNYGRNYGSQAQYAPTDAAGAPIYHALPSSSASAKNDGELWRWALHQAAQTDPFYEKYQLGDFAIQQFGTTTLGGYWTYNFDNQGEKAEDKQKAVFQLETLGENETLARLASGIKRFVLPDDYNYIKLYKEIAAGSNSKELALARLANIFQDRRQFNKAAEYWTELTKLSSNQHYKSSLQQIVGNLARFDPLKPQAASKPVKFDLVFRNAKSADFEILDVKSDALIQDLKDYLKSRPVQLDYLKVDLSSSLGHRLVQQNQEKYLGKSILKWSEKLEPREAHFDRRVSLQVPKVLPAGLYLLKAQLPEGNLSQVLLWVQDSVLVAKTTNNGTLYYLAEAEDGKPIPNANLEFFGYSTREDLVDQVKGAVGAKPSGIKFKEFTRVTDSDGLITISSKDLDKDYSWLTVSRAEAHFPAMLGFSYYWPRGLSNQYEEQLKPYLITDRPVYRPAQPVKFKIWLGRGSYRYDKEDLSGKKLTIEIYDPQRKKVYSDSLVSDSFGGVSSEFTLEDSAALGIYSVSVLNYNVAGSFRVEEYKKPEFEVLVEAPKEGVKLGDAFDVKIKAKYYYGEVVRKAKVKFKVQRTAFDTRWFPSMPWDWLFGPGYWWFASDYDWLPGWTRWGCFRPLWWWFYPQRQEQPELIQEQELDLPESGELKIKVDTSLAKALHEDTDHRYQISAEVTDQSRRTILGNGEVIATRKAFQIFAWTERGYYKRNEIMHVNFQARSFGSGSAGSPVSGSGKFKLLRLRYDQQGNVTEKVVQEDALKFEEDGNAKVKLQAAEAGQYRASALLVDGKGNEIEGAYVFSVYGDQEEAQDFRFNALEIVPQKAEFQAGDTAELSINTAQSDSWVLFFDRAQDGVVNNPKLLHLKGKQFQVNSKISEGDMPNVFLEALSIRDAKVSSEIRQLVVPPKERVLQIEASSEKEFYTPGEEAKLSLKVKDQNGRPYKGAFVLSVYDKALEYISGGSNVPEIRAFFWKWKRTHSEYVNTSLQRIGTNIVVVGQSVLQAIGAFGHNIAYEVDGKEDRLEQKGVPTRHRFQAVAGALPAGEMLAKGEGAMLSDNFDLGAAAPAPQEKADSSLVEPPVIVRKEFADTAFWQPALLANENGEAQATFKVPDNLSTWKARAWAMGSGTRVGEATTEFQSKKDLILRLQTPRFAVENDQLVISANLHNYRDATVNGKASLKVGENIQVLDSLERELTLDSQKEVRVDWRVKVLTAGPTEILAKFVSSAASDAMQVSVPLVIHGALRTQAWSGVLREGLKQIKINFDVPSLRNKEQSKLEIKVSPSLALAMLDALPYLSGYAYGCTEQTLNKFLPTLITHKVLNDLGVNLEDLKKKRSNLNSQELGDPQERAKQWKEQDRDVVFDKNQVEKRAMYGLSRLLSMQLSDGGWGWFSGWGEKSSAHTTAVVVHGLLEAKRNNLIVEQSAISRGLGWLESYQKEQLRLLQNYEKKMEPNHRYPDNIDALVLSVLTEAKQFNQEMGERLFKDRLQLSMYGKLLLAEVMHRAGKNSERDQLLKFFEQYLEEDEENQTAYLRMGNEGYWWYWYGSEIETHAIYLRLLSQLDPKGKIASRLVKYLLNNRKHASYWDSTRDTALVLEAFAQYLRASGELQANLQAKVILDGKLLKTFDYKPENVFTLDNTLNVAPLSMNDGKHTLEFVSDGKSPLYYNAYLTNFEKQFPIQKAGLELKVTRSMYKLVAEKQSQSVPGAHGQVIDENTASYKRELLKEGSKIDSGDLVEVELSLESKNDYEYLAIEDPKAAGLEALELQSGYTANSLGAYIEYRDQKVVLFARTLPRGKRSVSYRLRAEIPGIFHALPTQIFAMYAPELRGNSDEDKIEVLEGRF